MKLSQALALVAVVVGLTGGVAFLSQWTHTTAATSAETASGAAPGLYFPLETITLKDEVEVHSPGKCDFTFENRSEIPVEVGLEKKGCTCEWVEMCVLNAAQSKKFDKWPPDLNQRGGADTVLGKDVAWQRLDENVAVTVPAGAHGLVRLGWDTKEAKPVRLRAAVWFRRQGDPQHDVKDVTYLGVLANVVPALQVYPHRLEVPPLNPGKTETVECWCWSATRDHFKLQAKLENTNPCIGWKIEELSPKERDELVQRDRDRRPLQEWTHVRCGYHVTLTFHEQLGKSQLDLGYFEEMLSLSGGDEELHTKTELAWAVRGSVHILADKQEDRDMVILGKFPADIGATRDFCVQSTDPEMQLALTSWDPKFVKVAFQKESGPDDPVAQWRLTVSVPPNVVSGRFGGKGHIILTMLGPKPRHLRIPIYGTAYRIR